MSETEQPRVRTRAIDLPEGKPQPTTEMLKFARDAHSANKIKNKGSRDESAAKKLLAALMAKVQGLTAFDFKVGSKVVDVTYKPTTGSFVNVDKLIEKVGADKAMPILGVSYKAVQDAFGTNIADACVETFKGDASLSVKERK